jgi:hypothetical protein
MVPATERCDLGRTVRGMQLPLPADVLVPLGIGVIVAVVAVVALIIGLRGRADEPPAPTHADWTGENVIVDVPVARRKSDARRTVADAIAARRADTDPFPAVPHPVAVMDNGGVAADPAPEPLDVAYRDGTVPPPPPCRPLVPTMAPAATPGPFLTAAVPAGGQPIGGRSGAGKSAAGESTGGLPVAGQPAGAQSGAGQADGAKSGADAVEAGAGESGPAESAPAGSGAAVPGAPSADSTAARRAAAGEPAAAAPAAVQAHGAHPGRLGAPGQPSALAQSDGTPVRPPAPSPLAAQAPGAAVDSPTLPAATVRPAGHAPRDRAAVPPPVTGPGHVNAHDQATSAAPAASERHAPGAAARLVTSSPDRPGQAPADASADRRPIGPPPVAAPDMTASANSGSPDQNGSARPPMGRPRPPGPPTAGSADSFRPARHAAGDPDPVDPAGGQAMPGSTGQRTPDHRSAAASDPTDQAKETPIPHQSMAAGSSRNVGAAVAHALAARAAAPSPGADRRGDARDRLLAALLDDPRGAVGAVVDLQDCQERMDRIVGALHEERGRLRDVLGRLARSGLRADQLARLSGLPDEDVTELLRRNTH